MKTKNDIIGFNNAENIILTTNTKKLNIFNILYYFLSPTKEDTQLSSILTVLQRENNPDILFPLSVAPKQANILCYNPTKRNLSNYKSFLLLY